MRVRTALVSIPRPERQSWVPSKPPFVFPPVSGQRRGGVTYFAPTAVTFSSQLRLSRINGKRPVSPAPGQFTAQAASR